MSGISPLSLTVPTLLFATSGTGKSTFIHEEASPICKKTLGIGLTSAQRSLGRPLILDGDDVIQESVGWPEGTWWEWMTDAELDEFVEEIVTTCMLAAKNSMVLFGVFPRNEDMLRRCLKASGLKMENLALLMIPNAELERNMESRALDPERGAKPIDPVASRRGLEEFHATFTATEGSYVDHWSEMPALFGTWLRRFSQGEQQILVSDDGQQSIVDVMQSGKAIRSIKRLNDSPTVIVSPRTIGALMDVDTWRMIYPSTDEWRKLSRTHRDLRYGLGVAPRLLRRKKNGSS